jgi:excisionase family DNA binding protein
MATDPASRERDSDIAAPMSVLDQLMTAAQIASVLQLRPSTVEDYARRGVLPSIKLGRHRRFLRSQVEDAIVELSEPCARRRRPLRSSR